MAWRLAAAALVLLLAGIPSAAADVCTAQGPYGPIQYTCGGSSSASSSSGPWWATQEMQTILAIVGMAGSAGAGGYAFWRVRKGRKLLTDTILRIESTYAETKAAPEAGIPRLVALRAEIRARHQKGKLDDGHYLELDKRATDYIVRLRFLEMDRRFLGLPPALMAEVRRLVGDGVVSQEDVELVDRHANAFRVPEPRRGELVALVQSWCSEDVHAGGDAQLPAHELLVR
jgi:hypothetical protein